MDASRFVLFLLVARLSFAATAAAQEIVLQDVASDVGLVFSNTLGPAFAETEPTLALTQRHTGNGAAVGDADGDGDLDVYLLGGLGHPNAFFRNQLVETGTATFVEVSAPALEDLGLSRTAHFADLDGDGDQDLILINDDAGDDPDGHPIYPPSKVLRNLGGGTFEDATPGSGFRVPGYLKGGAALGDVDRDGLIDIYVTNWGGYGFALTDPVCVSAGMSTPFCDGVPDLPGSNRLLRNLGGFQFSDITEAGSGLGVLARDGFAAVFADFEGDAYLDLLVAVDFTSDEFYRNESGSFANATLEVGVTHAGDDMGLDCADFDDDGDLDCYSTNITGVPAAPHKFNVFYENDDNGTGSLHFTDTASSRGLEDTDWGWGVSFVDLENDGDLDIVAATGTDALIGLGPPIRRTPGVLFVNDGTGHFTRDVFGAEDDSRALVTFDFDRDGDQDILITNVDEPARLFENRTSQQGHWFDVDLGSVDAVAIGAIVTARVGTWTQRRDVLAGRSFLSGTPPETHFGLGMADRVDELRIRWANGTEWTETDVAADQLVRFRTCQSDIECNDDDACTIDRCDPSIRRCVRSPTLECLLAQITTLRTDVAESALKRPVKRRLDKVLDKAGAKVEGAMNAVMQNVLEHAAARLTKAAKKLSRVVTKLRAQIDKQAPGAVGVLDSALSTRGEANRAQQAAAMVLD